MNDGSTDNTISEVQKIQDPRIHLINQENAGVGAARNLGIEAARGEWIAFVDCDDYVDSAYLQTLISLTGIGCMPAAGFSKNDATISALRDEIRGKYAVGKTLPEDYLDGVLGNTIGHSCWNKLFSRQLLNEHGIRFETDLKLGEDLVFVFRYLCYCNYVAFAEKTIYHYCDNVDSAVLIARDQSFLYESTLNAMCCIHENGYSFGEEALCRWSLGIMTYVLSNPYVSSMSFSDFRSYFKSIKNYRVVAFASRAYVCNNFRRRFLQRALHSGNSFILFIIVKAQSRRRKRNSL